MPGGVTRAFWKGIVIGLLVGLGVGVFITKANAQQVLCPSNPVPADFKDAQLCWVNSAKDVNGNNLPAKGPYSIVKTRIQRVQVGEEAKCNFDNPTQVVKVDPNVLAYKFHDLKVGSKQCFRIQHISHDAKGKELYGKWSNTGVKTIKKPSGQLTVH